MFTPIAHFNLLNSLLNTFSTTNNIENIKGDNNYIFFNLKYRLDFDKGIYNNNKYNFIRIIEDNEIIACLDFIIKKDNITIEYLSIENEDFHKDYYNELSGKKVNNEIKEKIKKILLEYVYKIAKKNNINLILLDVHSNLKKYNREYKKEGFILSNNRCLDNHYWIESYKII